MKFYLYFSKGQRRGVLFLLLLIIAAVAVRWLLCTIIFSSAIVFLHKPLYLNSKKVHNKCKVFRILRYNCVHYNSIGKYPQ